MFRPSAFKWCWLLWCSLKGTVKSMPKEPTACHLFLNAIDFSFPLNSLEMIRKWCVMPKPLTKALLISHPCLFIRKSYFSKNILPAKSLLMFFNCFFTQHYLIPFLWSNRVFSSLSKCANISPPGHGFHPGPQRN